MDYKALYDKYLQDGCLTIENFFTQSEIDDVIQGVHEVIEDMPTDSIHAHSAYSAPKSQDDEEYYLKSGDKIAYFFELDAFDKEGNLIVKDKREAICKIAYALHWWQPRFKRISFSNKIKELLRHFQYKDPVVAHSQLIFKKPEIGEIYRPHQDSTFLYTEPPTSFGIWIPLDDATTENGCLWFIPGSHKNEVFQRFSRTPGNVPLMSLKGKFPEMDDSLYVPVPAKKGDLVLIHGSVVHKSGKNNSNKARIAYTYHVVERDAEWSKDNWLQPTEKLPFPSVYAN